MHSSHILFLSLRGYRCTERCVTTLASSCDVTTLTLSSPPCQRTSRTGCVRGETYVGTGVPRVGSIAEGRDEGLDYKPTCGEGRHRPCEFEREGMKRSELTILQARKSLDPALRLGAIDSLGSLEQSGQRRAGGGRGAPPETSTCSCLDLSPKCRAALGERFLFRFVSCPDVVGGVGLLSPDRAFRL